VLGFGCSGGIVELGGLCGVRALGMSCCMLVFGWACVGGVRAEGDGVADWREVDD
jgi:hypothetical protein